MTVVKVFVAYDDYENARGKQVLATRTETLSFAGQSITLDLTDETVHEIRMQLAGLFKLGTPPPEKKLPRGRGSARYPYLVALRRWAESIGEPIVRQPNGKYSYPKGMQERYDAYLKTQLNQKPGNRE